MAQQVSSPSPIYLHSCICAHHHRSWALHGIKIKRIFREGRIKPPFCFKWKERRSRTTISASLMFRFYFFFFIYYNKAVFPNYCKSLQFAFGCVRIDVISLWASSIALIYTEVLRHQIRSLKFGDLCPIAVDSSLGSKLPRSPWAEDTCLLLKLTYWNKEQILPRVYFFSPFTALFAINLTETKALAGSRWYLSPQFVRSNLFLDSLEIKTVCARQIWRSVCGRDMVYDRGILWIRCQLCSRRALLPDTLTSFS